MSAPVLGPPASTLRIVLAFSLLAIGTWAFLKYAT